MWPRQWVTEMAGAKRASAEGQVGAPGPCPPSAEAKQHEIRTLLDLGRKVAQRLEGGSPTPVRDAPSPPNFPS